MSTATCIADELITRAGEPEIGALLDQIRVVIVPRGQSRRVRLHVGGGPVLAEEPARRPRRRHQPPTSASRGGGPGSSGNVKRGQLPRRVGVFRTGDGGPARPSPRATTRCAASVDIHCFGQLVLYPWGWVDELAPADGHPGPARGGPRGFAVRGARAGLRAPARGAVLSGVRKRQRLVLRGSSASFAFTYELRPQESDPHREGFVLPPGEIRPVCQEAMASVILLAEFAIASEPGVPGDDGNADTDGWGGSSSSSDGGSEGIPEPGTTSDGSDSAPGGTGTGGQPPPATTAPGGPGTSGASAPTDVDLDDDGCACNGRSTAAPWGLLVLLLALRRRQAR